MLVDEGQEDVSLGDEVDDERNKEHGSDYVSDIHDGEYSFHSEGNKPEVAMNENEISRKSIGHMEEISREVNDDEEDVHFEYATSDEL